MQKRIPLIAILVTVTGIGSMACRKPAAKPPTEKIRLLFGAPWVYDTEATRVTVMQKAHDALGGGIKNLKDIQLKGDVKKMADALSAREIYFAEDKKGRGVGYVLTTGKGLLSDKSDGWLTWSDDETQLTLTPTDKKRKTMVYTLVEVGAKKLVILHDKASTGTPEVYTR